MKEVGVIKKLFFVTPICSVCKKEGREVLDTALVIDRCCGAEMNFRIRHVTELANGQSVESIIEDDQPPTTRFVGHFDG